MTSQVDGEALDWAALIDAAMTAATTEPVLTAETFVRAWGTASSPVTVTCDDGEDYVIKSRLTSKQAVTDQILGSLGRTIGCPIPEVVQVEVPAALIAIEPGLQHFPAGRAHGSRFSVGFTEREALAHAVPENFGRFAHLAAFYGWAMASDHQFIYQVAPPPLVLSVDHGHFIGSGDWDEAHLAGLSDDADLDPLIEAHCPASRVELQRVCSDLDNMTDAAIALAVGRPPSDWDISAAERSSLAALLARRRDHLKARIEERLS